MLISLIDGRSISCEVVLKLLPLDLTIENQKQIGTGNGFALPNKDISWARHESNLCRRMASIRYHEFILIVLMLYAYSNLDVYITYSD